jgi:hypothetical protein
VNSTNVRGVEMKSSRDKRQSMCVSLQQVLFGFGDFQRDVTLKIGPHSKFSVHLPRS